MKWALSLIAALCTLATAPPSLGDEQPPPPVDDRPRAEFAQAARIEASNAVAFVCSRPLLDRTPCLRFALVVYHSRPNHPPLGVSLPYTIDRRFFSRLRRDFGHKAFIAAAAIWRCLARSPAQPSLPDAEKKRLLSALRGAPHYRLRSLVQISPAIERRLEILAGAFYRKRRRRLLVTSGKRGSEAQARAMYIKLILRANLRRLYRQKKAVSEVIRAYRQGRRKRLGRRAIISAMAQVIDGQIKNEIFLSPHLKAGAVDVRSRGMRRRDRRVFYRLARRHRWVRFVKLERRPPHFHVEIEPEP